jgi:hypothetical protein
MTTFEFFKERYEAQHDYLVKCINPEIPVDSFEFVQIAWRNCWGGTTQVDPWFNIIGVEDTKQMFDLGYLKKCDGADRRRHIALTAKGLKAFYKAMF